MELPGKHGALLTWIQAEHHTLPLPNTAVAFPPVPDALEIEDTSYLDFNAPFSIILLMKIDALPGTTVPVLSKPGADPGGHGNYSLYVQPDGNLSFGVTGEDGIQYTCASGLPMQPGMWHLVLAYLDHSELGMVIDRKRGTPVTMASGGIITNDNNLVIGNLGENGPGLTIDELWVYNRGMKSDFTSIRNSFTPMPEDYKMTAGACPPADLGFNVQPYGPFLRYRFYRDTLTIQDGTSPECMLQLEDDDDLGTYYCDVHNGYNMRTVELDIDHGRRYEGLTLYDSNDAVEFYAEHDEVRLSFYVSSNLQGLVYEVYHNGVLMPDVFRGIVVIEDADPEAMGEYYFVVHNGCERMVSDTVTLVMQGSEYVSYEAQGWDWTTNIIGNGNSYFSSICWSDIDSCYVLLGHFSGGLKIEDREYFSSQADDIFILKFDHEGNYKWSQVITSPYFKGKGDLVADPLGNLYMYRVRSGIRFRLQTKVYLLQRVPVVPILQNIVPVGSSCGFM